MFISDFDNVAEWVSIRTGCSVPDKGSAIGFTNLDDEIVAGVLYENFTGASITATIAIESGTTLPASFIRYILEYPFEELGVKKIFAMIAETNGRSAAFVKKLGFVEETRVKDYFEGGDMIVFACTPESCEWNKE
jgi:RimJ/RimL family protein N-acetyltransferase